ncbi:acetylxylan esterase [bacterium]|nr:acetylxylan esterase [bacterium]
MCRALAVLCLLAVVESAFAQPAEFNYDEAKVPKFELTDPLTLLDGTKVTDAKTWTQKRRPELLRLFKENVYGTMPGVAADLWWKAFDSDANALGGKATRRQITIYFTRDTAGPQMDLLLYVPNKAKKPVPAFVGLNFKGNHTVHSDPAIRLATIRPKDGEPHPADPASRGERTERWQVEMIVDAGYAIGTVFYSDIDPDCFDDWKNGIHPLFPNLQNRDDNFTSIGAWAWGLSRVLDYLEKDDDVDAKRVAVMGHSRLGKTSLWSGATDQRWAMVISNDSGCGGAALSKRRFGETVKRINTSFPHWFCAKFKTYNDNETALPVDQHLLISLMAPRPVYVASAVEDQWADPRGEFLSAKYASPVYELLGCPAIPDSVTEYQIEKPIRTTIGHHIRTGKHDVTAYDWRQYIAFANEHLK